MPYENMHSARQEDPDKYDTCRMEKDKFGEGIHAVFCKETGGDMELQSVRFDADKFTEAEAKEWLKEHDHKVDGFEKAKEESMAYFLTLASSPAKIIKLPRIENGVSVQRYKKELIKTGKYVKSTDGIAFEVTDNTLDHWVATFSQWTKNGNKIPIPATHPSASDPEKNHGWMVDLYKDGHSLIGVIDLYGDDAPKLALTSDVSIFVPVEFIDGKGNVYRRPITHVALCTDPVIPGLKGFEVIAASLKTNLPKEKPMDWSKIKSGLSIKEEMKDETAEALILSTFTKLQEDNKKKIEELEKANSDLKLSLQPKTPDPLLVKLASENREMKLNALVASARITPAVKEKLATRYVKQEALSLSLAKGDDGFDDLIAILAENDPVKLKEQTGPQVLELQYGNQDKPNVLVADAERRKKEAEGK